MLVIALGLLAACSSKQEILLHSNGSGTVHFQVSFSKSLMNAAASLSQGGSTGPQPGKFDIPALKKDFSKNPALHLESLSSPQPGVLTGSFSFKDVSQLFAGAAGAGGIVTYTQNSSGNVLRVHITRANFTEIAGLTGMKANPLYQMFGPEQNAGTTPGDLDQMMVYVLGDSGPAALKASNIEVTVHITGKLISQTGGVRKGNSVQFTIPLTQLLLLPHPLDYSVTFS